MRNEELELEMNTDMLR